MKKDCKDTLTFLEEASRMCRACETCEDCPLCRGNQICTDGWEPAELLAFVQEWSDAHPPKIYREVLPED